jgi:Gram-negative bacterial TonB protein C-terminal/PilZ domain
MSNIREDVGSFTAARDRRQHSRTTTSLTFVELGDSNGGIVLNISEGGLAMTAAAVLVGERLPRIRFQLPEHVHWLETSGRIVWLSESKKEAGIQFDDLAEEDGHQIKQWISSRASPSEIEDPTRTIRKSGKPIEFPSPSATVKVTPELEMVEDIEQWQFEDLFPSESVPRLETQVPSAFPVRPPSTQADGHTDDSLPAMAWQSRNDRVDAGSVHRNKLRLAAFGGLVVATSFAIGVALGPGPSERLLGSIEKLMPNRSHPTSGVAILPADSVVERSSPSPVGAPERRADTPTRPPRTPASAVPSGSTVGNKGTLVIHRTPSDAPRVTRSAENKTMTLDQRREPILVTAPSEGDRPFLLTVPEKAVSASSSFAISSQSSVLVPPEAGPSSLHQPERLLLGSLISHVEPQYPPGRDQIEIEEIAKLRATVGENGQITEVKRISGPMPLITAAMSAIRQWRYTPTLLNGRPVRTEEDVTIEFRAR